MKTANVFAAALVAAASLPLLAQQAGTPPAQRNPQDAPQASAPAAPAAAAVAMSPVKGELVDKIDSKTAKAGDNVVIKTKDSVKTPDGMEIPKGSKLLGHVTGVKPSGDGNANSQVSLQFDRAELKGGQSVSIHSEIQSLAPPDGGAASPDAASAPSAAAMPQAGASAPGPGNMNGSAAAMRPAPSAQPEPGAGSAEQPAPTGMPAPGTVVARTGNIAIRTTSVPGVLLASNEPGQQDPRMAQSSGILLGAKRDIHLDGGTQVVIGVAAGNAGSGGGTQ